VVHVPRLAVRVPTPSISGLRVVWPEFVLDPDGTAKIQIELYDLANEKQSTLLAVDPTLEDIWSPSIAGDEVAWAHRPASGPQELVVANLVSGTKKTFPVGGEISCALSADGRYLAWDDSPVAMRVLDLDSGEVLQYAGDEGWGILGSGDFVSWQPDIRPGGYGGFYDVQKKQVRFVPRKENSEIVTAMVMGSWFVWQDRTSPPWSSPPSSSVPTSTNTATDYFYFLRLDH
jgi:hypothetical protein